MYHPERMFTEPLLQTERGIINFALQIERYFLPHKPDEIAAPPPRIYRPRTFEGIRRHRHELKEGSVIIPREERLAQKYRNRLAELAAESATSADGENRFTRRIKAELAKKPVFIERNKFPYNIPENECMQFSVWYNSNTHPYTRAYEVAAAVYTEGLDPEDMVLWINIPRHKSVPSIEHAQLIIKYYPDIFWRLFQRLPMSYLHQDIYDLPSNKSPNHSPLV